jgi:hypothetical protein
MQNQSIENLEQFIKTQKDDFLKDGKRVESIIRDTFPENKSIANIMMSAWKEGVIKELKHTTNPEVTIARFSNRLSQDYSLKESSVLTAVRVWAYVLDVVDVVPDINISSTSSIGSQPNITNRQGNVSSLYNQPVGSSNIKSTFISILRKINFFFLTFLKKLLNSSKFLFVFCVIIDALLSFAIGSAIASGFSSAFMQFFIIFAFFLLLATLLILLSKIIYFSSIKAKKKNAILLIKGIIEFFILMFIG